MPSRQVGEQERSEHRPAPAHSSEAPEQSVQLSPPMPMQLMNTRGIGGMKINNGSCCKFNPGTMLIHGTSMGLWPHTLDIKRITVGISGIAGMPMIGINGYLGLHVAMMMCVVAATVALVNRRSTSTRARLQNGRESSRENLARTVVEH